jgi:hypothetical protein
MMAGIPVITQTAGLLNTRNDNHYTATFGMFETEKNLGKLQS